jgi:hypothetical protein
LVVASDGVVYVNTWSGVYYGNDVPHAGGFLVALQDTSGVGKADVNQRFGETAQSGGAGGTGIGIYKGGLYAEINDKIVRYTLPAGSVVPRDPPQTVITGLPLGGDHPMHPFAIDAAGLIYVDVATATNSCQPKNRTLESPGADPCTELVTRGGIWRYDANKTDQTFSPAERFATGIRNAEGFAVDSTGHRIFVTQHGRLTAASDGRIFIGSITTRQIFVVKPGAATAETWIGADNETTLGVYGLFADDRSDTLWACFSSFPGLHGPAAQAPSALAAYDLQTGKLKARYVLPTPGAFCNDIAIGRDGATYVTDSDNMEIDRLRSGESQLQVWAGNGGFGPKDGILDGISVVANRVIVNTLSTNKVFAIPIGSDGKAGAIAAVTLNRAIEAPDGMRSFGKDSMLLVESGGVGRLTLLEIQGNTGELTTLKGGFPGGPVSVAVVGTTGYVLEGQLDALFGAAGPKPAPTPFHATAVEVGKPN